MDYSKLVKLYEKLASTTKRLEKTYYLADFLKKTPTDDLAMIALLVQGKIFPLWDETKIGVASRLIIKAINVATGIEPDKIEKDWKKTGDLGKTAENLIGEKKQRTLMSTKLTVKKVFANLQKLPEMEGAGSVDQKVKLIAELLSSASPLEARYLIRTVLEELRAGVGEGGLRDAIVWAFFGDKININYDEKTKKIDPEDRSEYNKYVEGTQHAFDILNDFGEVAKLAKTKGLKELESVSVAIGKPLKVMLFKKVHDIPEAFKTVGKPAAIEYKYDGFRCITGHTPIYVHKKGLISVKNVKKGDLVLTHKGGLKRVIAINKRTINKKERLFRIQSFLGNPFRISEGHRVLTYRDEKLKWVSSENLSKNELVAFPLPKFKIKCKELADELLLKNKSNYAKTIKIDSDFFKFLGYWIGDGFTNEHHNTERVGIVFNKNHKNRINEYKRIIRNIFNITEVFQSTQRGMLSVYWRDKPLRVWLSTFFRREWKGKMLPEWFYNISREQFKSFLEGWIDSDGHRDKLGRVSITTKERDLAMFAQIIGLKHKIVMAVKKFCVEGKTYYKLVVLKSNKHYNILNGYLITKLLKYEEIKYPDPRINLYNLQVEGDKSYCTTLFALHNCEIHKSRGKIKIFTRRLDEVTKQFPEVVEYVEKYVDASNFILDAEAVGCNPKTGKYLAFQSISQRIKRKYDIKEMAKKFPIELNVFDIIEYEGKSLLKEHFDKRRKIIEKIVHDHPKKIVVAKQLVTDSVEKAEKFYKAALKDGQEGVMVKNLEGIYKPGSRVGYGVKVKPVMESLDLVIVGATWGEGKRSGWLTSYVLACRDPDTGEFLEIGRVGTGIKELESEDGVTFAEMTKMLKPLIKSEEGKEVLISPAIVIEINFEEIQKSPTYSSGYALRFPRLVRVREDKPVDEVSDIDLVEDLYHGQRGR